MGLGEGDADVFNQTPVVIICVVSVVDVGVFGEVFFGEFGGAIHVVVDVGALSVVGTGDGFNAVQGVVGEGGFAVCPVGDSDEAVGIVVGVSDGAVVGVGDGFDLSVWAVGVGDLESECGGVGAWAILEVVGGFEGQAAVSCDLFGYGCGVAVGVAGYGDGDEFLWGSEMFGFNINNFQLGGGLSGQE